MHTNTIKHTYKTHQLYTKQNVACIRKQNAHANERKRPCQRKTKKTCMHTKKPHHANETKKITCKRNRKDDAKTKKRTCIRKKIIADEKQNAPADENKMCMQTKRKRSCRQKKNMQTETNTHRR